MSSTAVAPDSPTSDVVPADPHQYADGRDFRGMCAHIGRRYIKDAPLRKRAWLVLGSSAVQNAMAGVKPGETIHTANIVRHYAAAISETPAPVVSIAASNFSGAAPSSKSPDTLPKTNRQFFDELAMSDDEAEGVTARVQSRYFGVSVEVTATVAEIHNSLVVLNVPEGRARVLTRCTDVVLQFDHFETAFGGELAAVDLDTNLIYVEKLAMCAAGLNSAKPAGSVDELPIEVRVAGSGFEFTGSLEEVTLDAMTVYFSHAEHAGLAEANELNVSVYLPNYDDANITEIAPVSPKVKSNVPVPDDNGVRLEIGIATDENLLDDLVVWLGRKNPLF